MEFMYCIPDLELFIDKTIKKCLLEYDLDANDTEAVLDDMEKAWPKTPPRDSEKDGVKDCNDNTEKACSQKQPSPYGRPHSSEPVGRGSPETLETSKQPASVCERSGSQDDDQKLAPVTNGRKVTDGGIGDSDRSGSSSPDVGGDGKMATNKPAKLKSRLQQRYFEANQQSETEKAKKHEDPSQGYTYDSQAEYRLSNLDILASAANLHTQREEEKNALRGQMIRGHNQEPVATKIDFLLNATGQKEAPRNQTMVAPQDKLPQISSTHTPRANINAGLSTENFQRQTSSDSHPVKPFDSDMGHSNGKGDERLNCYASYSSEETIVLRREISKDSSLSSTSSHPALLKLPPEARKDDQRHYVQAQQYSYYPVIPSNHQKAAEALKSFPHSMHDHSSRIARIIAEELQKDDDCPHKSTILKNVPLVHRVNPDEIKPLMDISGSLLSNHKYYLSRDDRSPAIPAHPSLPQIRRSESSNGNHSLKNMSKNISYFSKNGSAEDNQPQDLSLKHRDNPQRASLDQRQVQAVTLQAGTALPHESHILKGYFSSPSSPHVPNSYSVTSTEHSLLRKPTSSSPPSAENKLRYSRDAVNSHRAPAGKWDRKDVNYPLAVDPKILRDMRMADTVERWSSARQSEVNKKRGTQ